MIYIGIDPSLNSTGVCVNINGNTKYYLITSKTTKKMKNFSNKHIEILSFEKSDTNKKLNEYSIVEKNKTYNIYNICSHIQNIVKKYKKKDKCHIYMEGVSYGSTSSAALVDLSGLNFSIRNILIMNDIDFTIVTPSQNKKFATGLGNADKEHMVFSWLSIEKHLKDITEIKIDDLADAYFLSNYYKQNLH